ncbi:hypothetical protein [Chromobacterium haemolyticum]|uniref:hypothetical protein n=1 Tax=Chromobacterium TaxID=535 RepID=UPI004057A004
MMKVLEFKAEAKPDSFRGIRNSVAYSMTVMIGGKVLLVQQFMPSEMGMRYGYEYTKKKMMAEIEKQLFRDFNI